LVVFERAEHLVAALQVPAKLGLSVVKELILSQRAMCLE
jgi:hypothetical protein